VQAHQKRSPKAVRVRCLILQHFSRTPACCSPLKMCYFRICAVEPNLGQNRPTAPRQPESTAFWVGPKLNTLPLFLCTKSLYVTYGSNTTWSYEIALLSQAKQSIIGARFSPTNFTFVSSHRVLIDMIVRPATIVSVPPTAHATLR
jgi:hypothetical protein